MYSAQSPAESCGTASTAMYGTGGAWGLRAIEMVATRLNNVHENDVPIAIVQRRIAIHAHDATAPSQATTASAPDTTTTGDDSAQGLHMPEAAPQTEPIHPTELTMLKEVLNANELSVDGFTDQEFASLTSLAKGKELDATDQAAVLTE